MRDLMRLRAPIAEDIFLHSSLMWLDHESRSSIIKPNDLACSTLQIGWPSNWISISLQFSGRNFWRHEVQLSLYYIHFKIAQILDLVSSNILLMQYWAGVILNSSIFLRGKSKSFENKSCKICHTILFVFHFYAIWSVTLNKPWNLIGRFVFSVGSSLPGKKMRFQAKNGAIRE